MLIGNRTFSEHHTYVMGILNVTPDSFSDGSGIMSISSTLKKAEKMISDGADVIDIGGESTRPGAVPIDEEEELRRVLPAVRECVKHFDIPVSVDTTKAAVARAVLEEGAVLINDVGGISEGTGSIVAGYDASICIMANMRKVEVKNNDIRRAPGTKESDTTYCTPCETQVEMSPEPAILKLKKLTLQAVDYGIRREKIIIDPGIGFGFGPAYDIMLMNRLKDFKSIGFPVLLGASRKSFIGEMLNVPVEERLTGTLASTACAVDAGCMFVRVHDVKENVRFIRAYEIMTGRNL